MQQWDTTSKMKLTEKKLRGIIREELQRLDEIATLGKVQDVLHGSFVAQAELKPGGRLSLDVEADVRFNVDSVQTKIGNPVNLSELEPILEGSTIEYAAAHNTENVLELHMNNGYDLMIQLSANTDFYIRR